jgi:PAS domain S-box-containing protein
MNEPTPVPGQRAPDALDPASRWQDIADRADVGLVRIDAIGRIVDVNPAASRLLGRGIDALRGMELALLVEPGQGKAIDGAIRALRNGDDAIARDLRYVRPHGETVSTLSRFSKVCDFAGVLRAVTVVLLDLGQAHAPDAGSTAAASEDLRSAMEALRVSEDRYRTLFESIDEGFCVVEVLFDGDTPVDYRFLECNPAFQHQTDMASPVGKRMREFAPNHEEHWFRFYGDIARTGVPARTVLPARSLGDRWYEVHAFPFGAKGSNRVAILFDDISHRMRAQQALRDSEERFRCIANVTPSMLWSATANGETTWLSDRWSEYTGQPDNVSREQRNRVIHPDDREKTAEAWRRALKGEPFETELRLRRKDGEYRWFLVRANPSHDKSGKITGWFGSTTDIQDHKLAESTLQDMDRRKDEFLATLAHELRNPLAPLRNCLHILRMSDEAEGTTTIDTDRLHGVMERQVGHLVRLVDDLMEVSRITRGMVPLHPQAVTIGEVVERAVETSRPLLDAAHHTLVVQMPAEPLPMRADPVRLAQVLSNLLNNAAKYTEPGGRVELTARREGEDVVIVVSDNGLGIATDQIDRVFDLFSQATHSLGRSAGGLGIGLTLVRSLVELHGGTVVARSGGLGQGSEFEVRLPLHDGDAVDSPVDASINEGGVQERLRLLVVDDNREHTDSLALYLRMTGHAVRTAYDAASALTWYGAFAPEAVLLDLGMPDVDGHEVCRRLRASEGGEKLVIVAITGWGQPEDRKRSEDAGFDAHLVKPVDPAALVTLVDSLLRMRRRD